MASLGLRNSFGSTSCADAVLSGAVMQDTKRDARSVLSRTGLLAELQAKGILNLVPAEVKQIHALLEADFNPLELCRKLVRKSEAA